MRKLVPAVLTAMVFTLVLAGSERPASAASARDALERIDANAAAVVVFRPKSVGVLVEWLQKFGGAAGPIIKMGLDEVTRLTAEYGVDMAKPATWSETGIDMDSPIAVGLAVVDVKLAEKAFKAMTDAKATEKSNAKVARPWIGTRVVMRVSDAAKIKKLMEGVAAKSGGALIFVEKADAAVWTGDMKGADKALKKAKVVAIARAGNTTVVARLDGDWLIVDIAEPFAGDAMAFDWKRDGASLLKWHGRKIGKGGATALLGKGAGARMADADFGIWSEPNRVLDTGKATGWSKVVGALQGIDAAQRKTIAAAGAAEVQRCEELRPVAQTGAFEDLAWTMRITPSSVEMSWAYGLRKAYALASAFLTGSDGLLDVGSTSDAVIVGAMFLNGLGPIRALPRPGVFAKGTNDTNTAMYECGWGGYMAGVAFGWPHLLGMAIDDAAQADPKAKDFVDNVRNVAVALRNVSTRDADNFGVLVASFAPGAKLDWIPQEAGAGKSSTVTVGKRSVTVWAPKSSFEPSLFKSALDGGGTAWGAAMGGQPAVKWFWGKSAGSAAPSAIAIGRMDVPRVMEQIGKATPMWAPYTDELRKRVGTMSGSLTIENELLVGAMKLELK